MVYGKSKRFSSMKSKRELDFEFIYKSHKDKIYRLCLGFVRDKDQSKDLFQEILIKIWRHLDSFKGQSEISTWVYRIAYNTAITFATQQKKREDQKVEFPENLDLAEPDSGKHEQEIQLQRLYQAITELNELDRIIATLLLEGTAYKTIAEISGISENYVAVKVNRIKTHLSQKLNPSQNGK